MIIVRDEIRKLALCAREYASANAPAAAVVHQTRQEPPITAFGDALRLTRPRHSAKPMVKRTRRSQPSSNGQALNYHVSIAKSAMEKLDSYDEQCQPMLKAIREARDNNRNGGHFTGASGAPTPISSSFPLARQVEREINYDASRDPRRRAINPLI